MKKVTGRIFIWIIICISTLGLLDLLLVDYNYSTFSLGLSILTSIIGLIGAILYFQKKNFFKYFILFWIIIQFVEFSELLIAADGVKYWNAIFISKQLLHIKIGQSFNINNLGYKLELNFIPILYLAFYQVLRLSSFKGKHFRLTRFRENNEFTIENFEGTIIDQVILDKVNESFIVKLSKPIATKENETFEYCVISDSKSKKFGLEILLNLNLYLLPNQNVTKDFKIGLTDLIYLDWIEGRITNPNKS
ncbi:hypothetical protein [Ancylomarina sp.]|uniref:hypothetical protein n=1 Tax=Ancylomarina sp. TaxID=1970196 RepID=UPI003563557A